MAKARSYPGPPKSARMIERTAYAAAGASKAATRSTALHIQCRDKPLKSWPPTAAAGLRKEELKTFRLR